MEREKTDIKCRAGRLIQIISEKKQKKEILFLKKCPPGSRRGNFLPRKKGDLVAGKKEDGARP